MQKKTSTFNPAQTTVEALTDLLAKTAPQSLVGRFFTLPNRLLNNSLIPLVDAIFRKLEGVFRKLEWCLPFLRTKHIKFELNHKIFGAEDDRENFLPVRFQTIADYIVDSVREPEDPEQWRAFIDRCAERFHIDFFQNITRLNNAFAPFDPDADALFTAPQTQEELDKLSDEFFQDARDVLRACNFVELPREEATRLLALRRPGALPLTARFDVFKDYHIFIRGALKTEQIVYPRWQNFGRKVSVESELLSRVCILARLRENDHETINLKIFKNILLEDLKLTSPRVEFYFPYTATLKIGGVFSAVTGIAIFQIVSFFFAAATTVLTAILWAIGSFIITFFSSLAKGALSFLNRRTKYFNRYSCSLYFQTLASNRSAISLLVSLAEDQETKEIVIGYFAAHQFASWATEKEIDDVAERWFLDNFGLSVDFESDDALRKLREKRLLEIREDPDAVRYRVVPLDVALRRLAEDWNTVAESPVDA